VRRLSRHDLGLVLVALIWGANYTIVKRALGHVAPVPFAAMRFLFSCAILVAAVRWLDGGRRVPPAARRRLLALGVVGHTLNQMAFVGGLRLTTATNSALIFASLPLAVAVLGALLGHEHPSPRVWLAIVLGSLGVAIVVGARGVRFSSATFRGDLITMLAVLCWAAFTVGLRWAAQGLGSLQVTMFTHLGGTPGLVLAALPGAAEALPSLRLPAVWGAILYSSLAGSVIAAVLWTRGLKALGGSRTALYSCVTPIFAGGIAWLALGERPLPLQGVGAVLVLAAVAMSAERGSGERGTGSREPGSADVSAARSPAAVS
jgi:drug/metabolite transporter (DMT)-like permease